MLKIQRVIITGPCFYYIFYIKIFYIKPTTKITTIQNSKNMCHLFSKYNTSGNDKC